MLKFICPITKVELDYPENAVFRVYQRKSNSPKRLKYVSNDIAKAWEDFLITRVYVKDFKYFYADDLLLLRQTSEIVRPKRSKSRILNDYAPYKDCSIGPIRYTPVSLSNELRQCVSELAIGQNRLIHYLLADFFELNFNQKQEKIIKSKEILNKYVLKDGGDAAQDFINLKKDLEKQITKEEDLL